MRPNIKARMKRRAIYMLVISILSGGAVTMTALQDPNIQIKKKYGVACNVTQQCGQMIYVDCGAATDGPVYYLDQDFEIIGTSGGLCMQSCTGAPKEWENCVATKTEDRKLEE